MAAKKKNTTESDRKGAGIVISIALFIVGVLTYILVPSVMAFFDRVLVGWKGLVYLMAGGLVLEAWFLIMGFRGKALIYALMVLVVTILCIWLYINFDLVWDSMTRTLGLWPTIFIVLFGTIGLWFVVRFFL